MCHPSVHAFAARVLSPRATAGLRVLEVGSFDVNGSLRDYIERMNPESYIGVDARPGPSVDGVRDACVPGLCESLGGPFDLVVCTEMLEHAQDWRAAVANLKACVAPGGALLVTTRSLGFPLHEFPGDYWRYELDDMRNIFRDFEIPVLEADQEAPGVLMYARAPERPWSPVDLRGIALYSMDTERREVLAEPALSVVTWKWGDLFGPEYVNRLRSMFARQLHVPHRFLCVTDDPSGVDSRVKIISPAGVIDDLGFWEKPEGSSCLRRLKQYDRAVADIFGSRFLSIDLDLVLVGDVTPLFVRSEPLVIMRWTYAGGPIYGGGIVLMDAGVLHGLWETYSADPVGYGEVSRGSDSVHVARHNVAMAARRKLYGRWRQEKSQPRPALHPAFGPPSDQCVLNYFFQTHRVDFSAWEESDGIVRYFTGSRAAYGPPLKELPPGVRIVVFGHDDKVVMEEYRHPWVREHWR